jgi:HSP20 family protein
MAPVHRWRDLLRWDPFAEMLPLGDDERPLYAPNFDVKETKEGFVFEADVPGVAAKDIDVQITDNRLTVSGKREQKKEQTTDTTYRCERSFGAFTRSFTLPNSVDSNKVQADIKDGVLTISIARKPEAQSKQVAVKTR